MDRATILIPDSMNSQAVKKVCDLQESHDEKSKIKGGIQEMGVMIG